MNNDPSYVEIQEPPTNRNTTSGNPRNPTEDADSSSMFLSSMTKLIETIGQQQNMMMPPTIPVLDGEPNIYGLFKMQFQNLYHRRCPDDATRLSFLKGLLSEKVLKKVRDRVDRPESYDFLWRRLDAEFGHIAVEASTALNNLLDLPILRSTKGKLVAEYAVEVHNAVSALSQCELRTELTSHSALRQGANKLHPDLREKWSEEM